MSCSRSVDPDDRTRPPRISRWPVLFFSRVCATALLALVCPSCAFFNKQPALPKRAAIESRDTPQADEKFVALVQRADIIYFPTELLNAPSRSAPVSKLVEALRQDGSAFALGWDAIGGEEQGLLDRWARRDISSADLLSRLHLSGSTRQREYCRALLEKSGEVGARFLALRRPPDRATATKIHVDTGELAPGFYLPPGDFERFAERLSNRSGMDGKALRSAYRETVREETFVAEQIVGYFREHRDEKLVVFVHRRHFESARGVPYLVAQKIRARQLVLDSRLRSPGLLAGRSRGGVLRGIEIVDRSPGAGRDQL